MTAPAAARRPARRLDAHGHDARRRRDHHVRRRRAARALPANRRPRRCTRRPTTPSQWFVRNQRPDGRWLYEYDAARQVAPDDYNLVRHAGGIMGLYQAATAGIDGALESADRGLEWAEGNLVSTTGGPPWRRADEPRSAARRCSPPDSPSAAC